MPTREQIWQMVNELDSTIKAGFRNLYADNNENKRKVDEAFGLMETDARTAVVDVRLSVEFFLKGLFPTFSREQEARDYLGSFGLGGHPSLTPLKSLSGGQKARVALALLLATKPHILLLDEPTNHLDLDTVEALVRAITAYEGAVVVASHDVRFLQEVGRAGCEAGTSGSRGPEEAGDGVAHGDVYVVGKGGVQRWLDDNGVQGYAERLLSKLRKAQGVLLQSRK